MPPEIRVNFLIVGTQKGGTSALAKFLAGHPDVCMSSPRKELHFFDAPENLGRVDLDFDRYHAAFPGFRGQPVVGEASPSYMYLEPVAAQIRAYNPAMKLILILRHPVDRAYSHYNMIRDRGQERLPFPLAIRLEPFRIRRDPRVRRQGPRRLYSYCDRGRYSRQIRNLLGHFPREQLLILRNEDLSERHEQTLKTVYEFLEVDPPGTLPEPDRVHQRDYRRPIPAASRRYLLRYFRDEVDTLESLLGWDLSAWRT